MNIWTHDWMQQRLYLFQLKNHVEHTNKQETTRQLKVQKWALNLFLHFYLLNNKIYFVCYYSVYIIFRNYNNYKTIVQMIFVTETSTLLKWINSLHNTDWTFTVSFAALPCLLYVTINILMDGAWRCYKLFSYYYCLCFSFTFILVVLVIVFLFICLPFVYANICCYITQCDNL